MLVDGAKCRYWLLSAEAPGVCVVLNKFLAVLTYPFCHFDAGEISFFWAAKTDSSWRRNDKRVERLIP
jgi:hypothetical protein